MDLRERRSGIDSRSEEEKQLIGERRSGIDRDRIAGRQRPCRPTNNWRFLHGVSGESCVMKRAAAFLE